MGKYPKLGGQGDISTRPGMKDAMCCLCRNRATRYQDIEFNFMRGDDEVLALCDDCKGIPQRVGIAKFLARAYNRKDA